MRLHPPRLTLPAAALGLAVAYALASVGLPVPRSVAAMKPCGCPVRGPTAECCCSKHAAGSCCAGKRKAETADAPTFHWVAAWDVSRCRGQEPAGLLLPPPGVPPAPTIALVPDEPPGAPVAGSFVSRPTVPVRPPTPPPRSA